ncbi:Predicted dioxygenase [Phaffia rhodozyma]|uniref:Predicted dioxygenase n=1 Tax=Phaffia rhodozyma TaxID=264483 RepID=A0A0F7SMH8_PHARH|nr:Predicted dioxygenase [Phaffia rhodozyma]
MSTRQASHAGDWYTKSGSALSRELDGFLGNVPSSSTVGDRGELFEPPVKGCKAVIAPHAGFSYSGPTAGWAYRSIDTTGIKRVFILGPSHHYYLTSCALSRCKTYETPVGSLELDLDVIQQLKQTGEFEEMTRDQDEDEHSIEMHLPFVRKVFQDQSIKIVPVLVGSISLSEENRFGKILAPYINDPETFTVVSSDFCHWGSRFRYTHYTPSASSDEFISLSSHRALNPDRPIYQSIEALDKEAINILEGEGRMSNVHRDFAWYLKRTKNTICGRHPIGVLLGAMAELQISSDIQPEITFVRYAQSSACLNPSDSSLPNVRDSTIKNNKLIKLIRANRRQLETQFPWMLSNTFYKMRKRLAGRRHVAKWTHPTNRVMFWNFTVGDKVRIRHGTPRMLYEDYDSSTAEVVTEDGIIRPRREFKIWTIASFEKKNNRVFLEGLEHDRSNPLPINPLQQPPAGHPPFERTRKVQISINCSNLQLLIPTETFLPLARQNGVTPETIEGPNGEKQVHIPGLPKQIFASRIGRYGVMGPDRKDRVHFWENPEDLEKEAYGLPRKWTFRRVALKTFPRLKPQFLRKFNVPWPEVKVPEPAKITYVDTPASVVAAKTWSPPSREDLTNISATSNFVPDLYLKNPLNNLPMEIYVGKELANPYARAKLEKEMKARVAARLVEEQEMINQAVEAWRLRETRVRLGLEPRVGRRMTEQEVKLTARRRYAELSVERMKANQLAYEQRQRDKHGPTKSEIKAARRAKEKAKLADKLRRVTLSPGRNQIIPAGAERVI